MLDSRFSLIAIFYQPGLHHLDTMGGAMSGAVLEGGDTLVGRPPSTITSLNQLGSSLNGNQASGALIGGALHQSAASLPIHESSMLINHSI